MNTKTAITQFGLNATDQYTPTGSLKYTQKGSWSDGTPHFAATQTLSPNQAALQKNQEQLGLNLTGLGISQSSRLKGLLATPFNGSNDATESRLMELGRKRLDPLLASRRASTEQDAFNRGVRPGSEAYENTMRRTSEGENDAFNQLLLTGHDQAYKEGITNRITPINEVLAMAGAGQVQGPNYVNTPGSTVAPVDYTGLVNQQYQAKLANYQSGMSGMFGLGSALIGAIPFSDERLKEDITKVGETEGGSNIYTFRYKGSPMMTMGVMAQEHPEAAVRDPATGFLRVDLAKVA
jgi:hypothetical protein